MSEIIKQRLNHLRVFMKNHQINALIIPSSDPHMSEYLPKYWQGRQWLSGFTGSFGTLLVLENQAFLWTDSRYWIQANIELKNTTIELKKYGVDIDMVDFLSQNLPNHAKVAIDGNVLSVTQYECFIQNFSDKNIKLISDLDLLNEIWEDRPPLPNQKTYIHSSDFIDDGIENKLAHIRFELKKSQADFHLISSLDDIAWITNLRGNDIEFNPVFLAYLFISKDETILFINSEKLDKKTTELLNNNHIQIKDYFDIQDYLSNKQFDGGNLLIDPNKTAIGTLKHLSKNTVLTKQTNPSTLLKAIKNPKALKHIKNAMISDGAALCEFFAEFEQRLQNGERLSELDVADLLTQKRSQKPYYVSASFDTIAGFAKNGAIVHYKADHDNFCYLDGDGLLLIDSGAQYQNGTTDITRMMGIGNINYQQKQDVTDVLKAHIALATACFPKGTLASELDVLARVKLWQKGLDYGHGTGHGVGYFLNVHEGPQSISKNAPRTLERTMKIGMVTSNEPGLYRTDKWGIRLENLMVTVAANKTEFGEFLTFETLTLCPFDTRLILIEQLNNEEKKWLNDYHQLVYDKLHDKVEGLAKTWLTARTRPV